MSKSPRTRPATPHPAMGPAIARGYARYVKAARRFPGVEESTSCGTPALKVQGKLISRWRTEAEGALAPTLAAAH